MNGHKHYRAAEKLLSAASFQNADGTPATSDGQLVDPVAHASLVARAQVHATLALAAAQAMPTVASFCGDSTRITDWGAAIGWDTVPDKQELQARITAALHAGCVADSTDVTDWQRGYRACWERMRAALDPAGEVQFNFPSEAEPF